MAQPAEFLTQDNRTDMGLPVFWTLDCSEFRAAWQINIMLEQILTAVTVVENVKMNYYSKI